MFSNAAYPQMGEVSGLVRGLARGLARELASGLEVRLESAAQVGLPSPNSIRVISRSEPAPIPCVLYIVNESEGVVS
jgi:hypothetical protein